MFGFGTMELLVFLAIILVLFGNRIPTAMRSLGSGMREFKTGLQSESDTDELVKS